MKKVIILIWKSILAGFLISLAGWIYLQCNNKIIGSVLFSIGLISIILLQANLFTGKIGYVDTKEKAIESIIILLINFATAYIIGLLYHYTNNVFSFQSRLIKTWYQILLDGFGCGILIYLAVELYNKTNNILLIILPVVCFILSGMEHSIADAFYFGASDFSWKGLGYICLIIIGNTMGSLFIRRLQLLCNKKD